MICSCFHWVLATLPLFVFGYAIKPEIGIGAIFDKADFDDFNSTFTRGISENQLLEKNNLTLKPQVTPLNEDIYTSIRTLCTILDGQDVRVLLVVGSEHTIRTVSQVAEPLGIPILGYAKDTAVKDLNAQVSTSYTNYSIPLNSIKPSQQFNLNITTELYFCMHVEIR